MGRSRHAVAVLALLALAAAPAARADDRPLRAPREAPLLPGEFRERQFLLPLVEIPLMNMILTWNNQLMFGGEWTQVSLASISRNLEGGWEFDTDDFEINNVGHPYQGSFPYLATRSAGYTFWHGLAGAFLGSLMWEIAGENEPPSINDMITTTFGGSFFGEALHRTSIALLRKPGYAPSWARILGSALLNPVGAYNRWLTEGRYDLADYDDATPVQARFSAGLNALGRVSSYSRLGLPSVVLGEEFHVGAALRSGLPGHRDFAPARPFDHFDVQLEVSVSRQSFAKLFITGLVVGDDFAWGGWGQGVWGLFGGYDFANPPVLRISTVSAGPGLAFAADLSATYQLQFLGVLSGAGWGAVGALPAAETLERTYHIGPGAQLLAELQFINRKAGVIRASVRQYLVTGAYAEPGVEWITYLNFGVGVELTRQVQLTFDGLVSVRETEYFGALPDMHQRASQVRLGVTWLTDADHGATRRPRPEP